MIYSASSYSAQLNYKGNGAYFMERQAMIAAAGFVGMLIISKIDYHIFARFSVAAYLMSYILMIAVSFVGKEVNGKKRWLPLGPFSFQPTEFVKIALIVLLAAMILSLIHISARVRATGGHPAKRTFQAIRIECNHELDVLEQSIDTMIELLNPGGRLSIITFHSLEDRIVKNLSLIHI